MGKHQGRRVGFEECGYDECPLHDTQRKAYDSYPGRHTYPFVYRKIEKSIDNWAGHANMVGKAYMEQLKAQVLPLYRREEEQNG